MMLKLKLEALDHPTPNDVNLNDRKVFASTVLWLEDQKIRQYKIEDRETLRKVDQLPNWEKGYAQYKLDLGMPEFSSINEEMSWLLGYAIRLEFLDDPDQFKDINAQSIGAQDSKSITPSIKAQNLFDNMDFNHKDFIGGVRALANKLKVPHYPNHLVQLEAITRIVHERLSPAAKNRQPIIGKPFPFEQGNDVVVSPNEAVLELPVRSLRLLQIQSLREMQTRINETIVAVQNLTANPKTDTKLGRVGR